MKRALKITLGVVASLIIAVVIATVALSRMVNTTLIKEQAHAWVKDNLQRELTIKGDLHWRLLPNLSLRADDIQLSNPKGFGDNAFATAKSVSISLRLLPLLHRNIAINTIELHDADIHLQKNKSGNNNWNFATPSTASQTPSGYSIDIQKLLLSNSTIRLTDLNSQSGFVVNNATIQTSKITPNAPFTLSGQWRFSRPNTKQRSDITFQGKLLFEQAAQRLTIQSAELSMTQSDNPINTFTLYCNGHVDIAKEQFALTISNMEFAKVLRVKGTLSGKHLFTKPLIEGKLTTNTFNAKTVLANMGHPILTVNSKALTNVQLTSNIQLNDSTLQLKPLTVYIDQYKINGSTTVNTNNNRVQLDLRAGDIVLDGYGLIPRQQKSTSAEPALQLSGQLAVNSLTAGPSKLENLSLRFNLDNQFLTVPAISATIFGGKTSGSASLNITSMAFSIKQHLSNIALAPLLEAALGESVITGRATLDINMRADGIHAKALQNTLNGSMNITATDGILYGVDVEYEFARIFAHLNKDTVQRQNSKQTPYQSLTASTTIDKGLLQNRDLSIRLPRYHIKGDGTVNLQNKKLDYDIAIKALYPVTIATPVIRTDLANYYLPIHIGGTTDDPKPAPDFAGIAKIVVAETAKEVIKQQLQRQIGVPDLEQAGELLKKALPFGR